MLQSQLFTKTRKEAPKDEVAKNASLLIRASFVDKLHAGVYTYLPLGFLVLKNIEKIIREEMNAIGGQELLLPALHPKENWEKTGRWESMDDLYKLTDGSGKEYALGATHEEVIVPLAKQFVSSYKDLPFSAYQIQDKFRAELRAKSGILRGREFIMKDLYSFHRNEEDLNSFYEEVRGAYTRIFKRCGIGNETHYTFADGGSFSDYSHEFQTVTEAGEDIIHICKGCKTAINEEVIAEQKDCPECDGKSLETRKAIEVGNIFPLKTKYSDPFELTYKDEAGKEQPVLMGCYGIGLGRLMGAIVEVCNDENGIIWPDEVAPFEYHLIAISGGDGEAMKQAQEFYEELKQKGHTVLFDDRDTGAGEKFKDADLLGVPKRIVMSAKTLEEGKVELKRRDEEDSQLVAREDLLG
ncbi:prolyl-tRNA synthetase [bacterium]|nr:prolyl-tRNA synthetase [bacterium]|tara:strand:+ start:11343 stop:12575 length:1233 start_codon:yes stop_codon:yes gene_type:complete